MTEHPSVEHARQCLMSQFWENRTGDEPPKELLLDTEGLGIYSVWFDIEGFYYETNLYTEDGKLVYKLMEGEQ